MKTCRIFFNKLFANKLPIKFLKVPSNHWLVVPGLHLYTHIETRLGFCLCIGLSHAINQFLHSVDQKIGRETISKKKIKIKLNKT